MADFKPPSAPVGSIGPPIGPPAKQQFQMPHYGMPSPLAPTMQAPQIRTPVMPGPATSPAPLPQYRPSPVPQMRPGLGPRPGFSPSMQPGPPGSASFQPVTSMSASFQPVTSSSVNGINNRLGAAPSPGLPTTGQALHPGMGQPQRPPGSLNTPGSANGLGSAFASPQISTQSPMHPSAPTSLPSSQPSMLGPMRPSPMGQSAATPTTSHFAGPPSSGPSPQFGAPPARGPSPRMAVGPPTSSSVPAGLMPNGPVSGPSLSNGPRPSGPLTNGPGSQFAPPQPNGPSTPYSGQSYNSQFGGPPSLNGPQFGSASLNGPTSSFRGPSPQASPRPGMHPAQPMQSSYSQPSLPPAMQAPSMMSKPQYAMPPHSATFSNQTAMPPQSATYPGQQPNATQYQNVYQQQPQQQGPSYQQQQHGGLPPPPPMSNFNGLNGGQSQLPPPPSMSSTAAGGAGAAAAVAPPMASSRLGTQPSRPAGMPPPIQQQQPPQQPQNSAAPLNGLNSRLGNLSFHQGMEPVDLLQNRHILPPKSIPVPKPRLQADVWNNANCSPDIFRCTLTKVPETESLLKKARLPLGVLIHPFKDLSHLPVIQCSTIVRCRQCRTYINPFVTFVDQRRWRCNICYRVDELPEEFLYDPVSKSYGDPSRRPECKSSTIEFIAPSEYMLRPPQPAVYVFCLDTSRQAIETGYLKVFCDVLLDELDKLPGDSRTQVAFITYDRSVHFYTIPEGANQPTQLTVSDIEDIFLPSPSDLLVNLHENRGLVIQLLEELPKMFDDSHATESALGAALQAAFKLASPTGGRITVFQHILPKIGPGALPNRESATESKNSSDSSLLGPATDFYKKMSLDCSGQQIAVDLFAMGSQYQDIATLSGMSKFSAGQIQQFPGYHVDHNQAIAAKFENALRRYLSRKIGFEAVMRVRCTRGLSLHTFHGNFFVRSTDLLSLPNINPDAGFGIQVAIEEDLKDSREVSFQAALLYTSSKGERRIRVHTLCLPTTASINDVVNGADEVAIVGMLTKFAADRAVSDSLVDAKEGLVVSCVDTVETYRTQASMTIPNGLLISQSLRLLPLHVLACLRSTGFRPGTKLDDRSQSFAQFKSLPLNLLMQSVYPDLYRVDDLNDEGALHEEGGDSSDEDGNTEVIVPQPDRLQLSFERISATGMYLMDLGDIFYLYLSRGLHAFILERCFGVTRLHEVNEGLTELPELENAQSEKLRTFIQWLNGQKPYPAPIKIIREDGKSRHLFVEKMIEDRMDNSFSYFEFLQHIKQQIK